jgi:hypothetical protein
VMGSLSVAAGIDVAMLGTAILAVLSGVLAFAAGLLVMRRRAAA